jgi:hypothetical protein
MPTTARVTLLMGDEGQKAFPEKTLFLSMSKPKDRIVTFE